MNTALTYRSLAERILTTVLVGTSWLSRTNDRTRYLDRGEANLPNLDIASLSNLDTTVDDACALFQSTFGVGIVDADRSWKERYAARMKDLAPSIIDDLNALRGANDPQQTREQRAAAWKAQFEGAGPWRVTVAHGAKWSRNNDLVVPRAEHGAFVGWISSPSDSSGPYVDSEGDVMVRVYNNNDNPDCGVDWSGYVGFEHLTKVPNEGQPTEAEPIDERDQLIATLREELTEAQAATRAAQALHRSDGMKINEWLNEIAETQNYCSEFEDALDEINGATSSMIEFTGRQKDYTAMGTARISVEINVPISASFTARVGDNVRDLGTEALEDAEIESYNVPSDAIEEAIRYGNYTVESTDLDDIDEA